MNKFIGTGTLPRPARVHGAEKKAVKFTLLTRYGVSKRDNADLLAYVPCVVFNPGPDMEKALTEGARRLFFEVEGHVSTSKFESNGETKYSTEVIVSRGGIRIVPELEPLPCTAQPDEERGKAEA